MTNRAKRLSRENGPGFLRSALIDVEKQFRQELKFKKRSITHDPTMGDAIETLWINLLNTYLPARYRVAKSFAIDYEGQTTDQLDCLIYDAHFTPVLFGTDNHRYIPAEAVYATFEIKQVVNGPYLKAAAKKASSLRRLKRTSAPIPWVKGINPPKKPFPILAGLLAMETGWFDGLGKSFQKQLAQFTGNEKLDLILTANAGFCDCFRKDRSPQVFSGEGALIRGLFRLLTALREKATVVAIDWGKYEDVLVPLSIR